MVYFVNCPNLKYLLTCAVLLEVQHLKSRNTFKGEPNDSCPFFNNNIVKYYELLALILPPLSILSGIGICHVYLHLPDLDLCFGQWHVCRSNGMRDLSLGLDGQYLILLASLLPLPLP